MKITGEYLKKTRACCDAVEWFEAQNETDPKRLLTLLIAGKKPLEWANWLLSKKLNKMDKIRYAIYAAEQVIEIYETKCPEDKQPRQAIQAAKNYLKNPCKKTKAAAAYAAADAAAAAAAADAYAAAAAAAAADAYAAAAAAADAAVYAADAAAAAADAYAAADAAAAYAAYARNKILLKIIKYGLKLGTQ